MDFKSLLAISKNDQIYYWSLVLEKNLVQAGIWTIIDGKAEMLSTSPVAFWQDDDSLIEAADASLSAAVQNFPQEEVEPVKTVFGVPNQWVEGGEIKQEILGKIKKLCSELSLEPSGFVVIPEAIAHLIKANEGSPLNAILLGISDEEMEVSVFRLGNLEGTFLVARSVSIADDVNEGLARFSSQEPFPSRIILYDGKEGELEDVRQALIDSDWDKNEKVRFLHTPKIEIIESEKKIIATALAGAAEISGIESIKAPVPGDKEVGDDKKEIQEDFVNNLEQPQEQVNAQEFGFVMGEDVAVTTPENLNEQKKEPYLSGNEQKFQTPVVESPKGSSKFTPPNLGVWTQKIKGFIKFKQSPFSFKSKKSLIIIAAVIGILILTAAAYVFCIPKANITIYVSPKKLEKNITLSVESGRSDIDFAENILPGIILSTQVSGEKTVSTTGNKTVGEKARGVVKIQNGTSSIVNLATGTVLYSSGDLAFELENSASISAAVSPSLPGEANANVVASNIGAEFNLIKDEIFKVGNYPKAEVDAISIDNFSGGSSRDISAVSLDDQKKLEKDLFDELLNQSEAELKNQLNGESILIVESLVATASSKSFTKKVGDEADKIGLDLKLEAQGISVSQKDIYDLIKTVFKDDIPSGYVLREDQIKINFETEETEKDGYVFKTAISANLLPEVDTSVIKSKVKGRSISAANNYLNSMSNFGSAEIIVRFRFPGINIIPLINKNIEIDLAPKR